MRTVNVHAAKTHFSGLLDQVASGEEIIIAKAGKPAVRLVPPAHEPKRKQGEPAGVAMIPLEFDADLPEDVLAAFEGR